MKEIIMKRWHYYMLPLIALAGSATDVQAAEGTGSNVALKIRTANFKICAEQSKLGKQEQGTFEALKKQMESVLTEREKVLNDLAVKFEDENYLDALSPEAETELKRKFRTLNGEYSQLQQQYLQTLQQANVKVVQKLAEVIAEAAAKLAKQEKVDVILNDEAAFFVADNLDVSSKLVHVLDQMFEEEKQTEKGSDKKSISLD